MNRHQIGRAAILTLTSTLIVFVASGQSNYIPDCENTNNVTCYGIKPRTWYYDDAEPMKCWDCTGETATFHVKVPGWPIHLNVWTTGQNCHSYTCYSGALQWVREYAYWRCTRDQSPTVITTTRCYLEGDFNCPLCLPDCPCY